MTLRPPIIVAVGTAALALSACSNGEGAAPPAPDPAPSAAAVHPSAATGSTLSGGGSEIRLSTLTPGDLDATSLPGELACSFSERSADGPLLIAKGDVASDEPAVGVVKVGSYIERIAAPGGFDAMLRGQSFAGQGKTVRIMLTGPASGGGESPPAPATLTYQRADGAERTFVGLWTCGP